MFKKGLLTVLFLSLLVLSAICQADDSNVQLRKVYLNNVSYQDVPQQISIMKDFLPGGNIEIRGRATSDISSIVTVEVSTDGQNSWSLAALSRNDGNVVFDFAFTPAVGEQYAVYIRATDATGATNDVAASGKLVSISDQSVRSAVEDTLDKLFAAYRAKDSQGFMAEISPDFAGNNIMLAWAIRKDFSYLDNYNIHYAINSIAIDPKGRLFATVQYDITVFAATVESGSPVINVTGTTQMSFELGRDGLKVYSIKVPVLFGFSNASNISSGRVNMTGSTTLIVAKDGTIAKGDPIEVYNTTVTTPTPPVTPTPPAFAPTM